MVLISAANFISFAFQSLGILYNPLRHNMNFVFADEFIYIHSTPTHIHTTHKLVLSFILPAIYGN